MSQVEEIDYELIKHLNDPQYLEAAEVMAVASIKRFMGNQGMCVEQNEHPVARMLTVRTLYQKLMVICADALARNTGHEVALDTIKALEEVVKAAPNPKVPKIEVVEKPGIIVPP